MAFFCAHIGQISNGFKIGYSEAPTYEIDLKILEQTFGDKNFFVEHSTDTLKKHLELLIEQKI